MERLELSNATFEGHNNVYLFADGPETVLIDTGDRMEYGEKRLKSQLEKHGVELSEIDRIFLTHWHRDHRGLAGSIQDRSGAVVYVHAADAALAAEDEAAWNELSKMRKEYFDHWDIPADKQEALADVLMWDPAQRRTIDVTPIEGSDKFSINDRTLRAVHAPGHAAGLCMFETDIDGGNDVLTGDALLPKYTPNIGGADLRVERPLEQYLDTLTGIIAADYNRAWPGHRNPIDDPGARAKHIIHHHEERAWRVLDTLGRRGPCDTWTVSDELFGELQSIHILHGPGEAYAHLEHLEREGSVVREGKEYRLADGVKTTLENLEEQRWTLER